MRGKVRQVFDTLDDSRITPAYAGKSQAGSFSAGDNQDHPRLCGEKLLDVNSQKMPLGSPPPMRGKVQSITQCSELFGITPAYAGKRCNWLSMRIM